MEREIVMATLCFTGKDGIISPINITWLLDLILATYLKNWTLHEGGRQHSQAVCI
jgi:hypothetical protein